LIKRLMDGPDASKLAFSVSHTTRKPREGEVDGIHYHFVSKEDFQAGVAGAQVDWFAALFICKHIDKWLCY
jgi:guanylate kinase